VARPLPSSRLLRRQDLAPRLGNAVRAVAGDRLVWGGLNSKGGRPHVPVSNSRPNRLLDPSVYPHNRSPQVYIPCHSPIESKWCSSKQVDSRFRKKRLAVNWALPQGPVRRSRGSRPPAYHCAGRAARNEEIATRSDAVQHIVCASKFEEQGGVSCMHKSGIGSIMIR
jgi:hypothetical protein